MKFRILGAALIILALLLLGFVWYYNSQKRQQPIIFSTRLMLNSLWDTYKRDQWDKTTGRTIDAQRGNITTSEGQSYTMLRAVWMDDKETFDKTWQWTRDTLQNRETGLFSWLWGKTDENSFGILADQGGQNAATDADQDIALALIFASKRWGNASYMDQAKQILAGIWEHEVMEVNGKMVLLSNDVEKKSSQNLLVNPSYFAPYAYRIFGEVDAAHPWSQVADSSYEILSQAMDLKLDKQSTAYLPPDWITINRETGEIGWPPHETLTTNFSFDAFRTPWRISLDWFWHQDERAKNILQKMNFLSSQWQEKKLLYSSYGHDGAPVYTTESPAVYGGTLGYFMVTNEKAAQEVYKNKLEFLYGPDLQTWKQKMGYYDDNWAWFGLALYNGAIINLNK